MHADQASAAPTVAKFLTIQSLESRGIPQAPVSAAARQACANEVGGGDVRGPVDRRADLEPAATRRDALNDRVAGLAGDLESHPEAPRSRTMRRGGARPLDPAGHCQNCGRMS